MIDELCLKLKIETVCWDSSDAVMRTKRESIVEITAKDFYQPDSVVVSFGFDDYAIEDLEEILERAKQMREAANKFNQKV